MAQQRSTGSSAADQLTAMYLESEQLFLDYISSVSPTAETTPAASTTNDSSSTSTICEPYQIRTLNESNMARMLILPIFPPDSLRSPSVLAAQTTGEASETPHLLLTNVWIERFTDEQYARIRRHAYVPLFKLGVDTAVDPNSEMFVNCFRNSYMWNFHKQIYLNTRKQLKIDMPIIDFNLKRLHECIASVAAHYGYDQTMLTWDEIPLALEFYLQTDVDMFYLKTCSFNNVKPRFCYNRCHEGLFCLAPPEARFAITPCDNRHCACCHSTCPRRYPTNQGQTQMIPFSNPHIHRFVNEYEAILNCPATCETTHSIYVLTCPCGQFDYIGYSKLSFATALAYHREEGNRIIREFLLGEINTEYLTHGLKSDAKRANDKLWLYQHSMCCSAALQLFLDENPDYWCFVPVRSIGVNLVNTPSRRSQSRRASSEASAYTIEQPVRPRDDDEVKFLVVNVPKPPSGFIFPTNQRQQQGEFFKLSKDRIVPRDLPDLYNADIVAVLPSNSSDLFHLFIESLFITHAECKLNEIGDLVYEKSDPNSDLNNTWCAGLTRRSSP